VGWLARMAPVAASERAAEDLAARVLAEVTLPRRSRWRPALTRAMGVVAVIQLALGVAALFGPVGMPVGDLINTHVDHEATAFNLAFGVILLLMAVNGRRASTMIPVLATFVGVHAIASLIDLVDGAVRPAHWPLTYPSPWG
jgi:predicted anti-sigma-YlaC factor YlaD